MKKYYEIEFIDGDYDLTEEEIEIALDNVFGCKFTFIIVREIPKKDMLTHENNKCNCSNFKVIADGNKGMEMGEIR